MLSKQIRKFWARWKPRDRRKIRQRIAYFEQLEARQMMAAAVWTNVLQPLDVSGDSQSSVTPIDALLIINELNFPVYSQLPSRRLPDEIPDNVKAPFIDVNCDGLTTPIDALFVINRLNAPKDSSGNPVRFSSPTWHLDSTGGSPDAKAKVTANACSPRLTEGDSYHAQLSTNLTLPDDTTAVTVRFDAPIFDAASKQSIRDAFEILVLDQAGQPVVLPFSPGREAVFNWTEGLDPAVGPATKFASGSATINLAGLAAGTKVTVVARLVNNDTDNASSVTLRGIDIVDSQTPAPTSFRPLSAPRSPKAAPDLAILTDVSSSVHSVYGRTTISNQDSSVLSSDLVFANQGSYPITGSLVAVLSNLSDPNVSLLNPDGFMLDGRPYLNLTSEMGGSLAPGSETAARSIQFKNATGERFTYQFQALSGLNQPPKIEPTPDAVIGVGDGFIAQIQATDPEGQNLTYSLESAPKGMTISSTGRITWTPATSDIGNVQVRVKVTDPLGGSASQFFTVAVRASVANRPPIITSAPPTDATVARPFEVYTYKTGDGPTAVSANDFGNGQVSIVTANAGEQQLGMLPGIDAPGTQVRFGPSTPISIGEPNPAVFSTPFVTAYNVGLGLEPQTVGNYQRNLQGLLTDDINGDGIADIVALADLNESGNFNVSGDPSFIIVRLGNGDGTFREGWQVQLPTVADRVSRGATLRYADVTGDGRNDLIVTMLAGNRTLVYPGNATGLFTNTPIASPNTANYVPNMQLADLNADGKLDIVFFENSQGQIAGRDGISVQFGDGAGKFVGNDFYSDATASGMGYLADVDGKNGPDLVRLNYNNVRLEVKLNDGTGHFGARIDSASKSFYTPTDTNGTNLNPTSAYFADFNGDGNVDVVVTSPFGIALLKGQGDGTFGDGTTSGSIPIARDNFDDPRWPGIAQTDGHARDINGDGILDLVFGDLNNGSNVMIGLGISGGGFDLQQYSVSYNDDIGTGTVKNSRTTSFVGIADFNRDGVLDVAIGSSQIDQRPGSIGILLGDKPGTLRAPHFVTDYSGTQGRLGQSVAGDFTGDGILDLATFGGLGYGSAIFVAAGKGDGTFGPYDAGLVASGSGLIALDIDKDGKLDLAWDDGNQLRQAFGLGNGAFQSLPVVTVSGVGAPGVSQQFIQTDDFNHDGHPDLVYRLQTGNIDSNVNTRVVVLLYDPTARRYNLLPDATNLYSTSPRSYGFYWDESIGLGDLNNDGKKEFFTFSRSIPNSDVPARLAIYEQTGGSGNDAANLFKRTVIENPGFIPPDTSIPSYVVRDFNGDGKNDIAYSTNAATTVVMLGNGDFTFRDPTTYLTNGYQLTAGDFNGDGHADLATTWGYGFYSSSQRPYNSVLLGNPDGTFSRPYGFNTATGTTNGMIVGDFNGDGKDDLVGLGGLKHSEAILAMPQGLSDVATGDVNGDGRIDTIAVNSGFDRIKLLLGDGKGDFERQPDLFTDRYPVAMELGDIDGDSVLDILTANKLGKSLSLIKHTSPTSFARTDILLSIHPTALVIGDMNGDSKPDAIVVSDEDQTLQLLTSSAGTLNVAMTLPLGFHPSGLALGDVTGDGKLDALVTDSVGGRVFVLPGDGKGAFLPSKTVLVLGGPNAIAAADMNADGRVDLIVTFPDMNQIGVLFNRGGTRFTTPQRITVGGSPAPITVRDLNGDAKPDLLIPNSGDGTVSVVINRFDPANVYKYKPTATDPDGDKVIFGLSTAPGGMLYDDASGTILWAPMPEQVGSNAVVLTANDGNGGKAEQGFAVLVTVPAATVAPVFTSTPVATIGANDVYTYQPRVNSANDQPLRFSLVDAPPGMLVDPTTGKLQWDARQNGIVLQQNVAAVGAQPSYQGNGEIRFPDSPSLRSASITAEGWFKFDAAQTGGPILAKRVASASPEVYSWGLDYSFGTIRASIGKPGVTVNTARVSAPFLGDFGSWQHYAMTFDNSTKLLTLYINGKFAASTVSPEGILFDGGSLVIGPLITTASRIHVWNVARTEAQIAQDALADFPRNTPHLVLDLRFDEREAVSTILDASSADNKGSLQGTPDFKGFPQRVPALATVGSYPVTLRVDDGKGGVALQQFSIQVQNPFTTQVSGTVFDDVNGNGIRDTRPDENLIVNSDFNSGAVGFSTDFVIRDYQNSYGWLGDGQATVGSSTKAIPLTTGQPSHTNGPDDGKMLIANGDSQDKVAWRQSIPVQIGQQYTFSFWALGRNDYESARFAVRVNGNSLGNILMLNDVGNGWKRFQATWTADSTTAKLEIVLLGSPNPPNPGLSGVENSSAIDDIVFVPSTAKKLLVPGNANPYLAGMPSGATAFDSTAPVDSPPFLNVTPGQVLRFHVTGLTTYDGGYNGLAPDGATNGNPGLTTPSSLNGISQLSTPNGGALVGVFLDKDSPAGKTPPTALDFRTSGNVPSGIEYTSLQPELRQLFFVGDGHANGTEQTIVVPAGATRLFLANGSGSQWHTNGGSFEVQVFNTASGEPGQAGRMVYADSNLNNRYDVGEPTATTDSKGVYALDVTGTTVHVGLVGSAGQLQTVPKIPYRQVDLQADPTRVNFGSDDTPLDQNPQFISQPIISVVAPGKYAYQVFAQASDGSHVTYSLAVGPDGMFIDSVSGLVQWLPKPSDAGKVDVIVKAVDGTGKLALPRYAIDVSINTAPIITSTPHFPATVGVVYRYDVLAQDAEQTALKYQLVTAPTGMSIDANTGRISWTPNAAGNSNVVVQVSDSQGLAATQSFTIVVAATRTNRAPKFVEGPRSTAVVGRTYASRILASDADRDVLKYSLVSGPAGLTIDSAGNVAWNPSTLGDFPVKVTVVDGRGGSDTKTYSIAVKSRLDSSLLHISSIPKVSAVVDQLFAYDLVADRAALFEIVRGPVGLSIDPQRGTARWLPTLDQIGLQTIVLRASDELGNAAEQTFTVTVRGTALVPSIDTAPPTEASVGRTYLYTVGVANASQSPLSFSLTVRPTGMTIDATTGEIVWNPVANQVGSAPVIVRVGDGAGNFASQSFSILVAAGTNNLPPVITSTPPLDATVGLTLNYDLVGSDPEGKPLSYSVRSGPAGLVINPTTGKMTWTPTAASVGSVPVVLVASDPQGASAVQSFTIDVRAANQSPVIRSTPPVKISQGALFQYDVIADDADREPLFYKLTTSIAGMTIDALGRIRWQTQLNTPLGQRTATVQVIDGQGGSTSQTIKFDVVTDTQAPRLTIIVSGEPVLYPWTTQPARVRVIAADDVGVSNLQLKVDGQVVELAPDGTTSVYFSAPGKGRLEAIATDAAGNQGTAFGRVNMRSGEEDGGGNPAPEAKITSVSDGAAVGGFVDVVGAAAAPDFQSYTLSYRRVDESDFKTILSSTKQVTAASLGKWDTTLLENDNYVLKLEVLDTFGSFAAVEVEVSVSSNLKLGNFRLSFEDMTIPVAGIPITIVRTYDTLRADRDGDFGYGWRLEFRDTDLRTSLPKSGLEDIGIYTPFKEGTKVYLTLPGGERQGFTFTPEYKVLPGFGQSNNLVLAFPRFTPDRGVTSTLSAGGGSLFVNEFGEMYAAGGIPWNPASPDFAGYTLTTRDGLIYSIDGVSGQLNRVMDSNGNALQFDDSGIASANGTNSVRMLRDSRGRITKIIDSADKSLLYAYTRGGDLSTVTDRVGNVTQLRYNSTKLHLLDSIVDPLNRVVTRAQYDANGRLVSAVNGYGEITQLAIDPEGRIEESTDPLGYKTLRAYDERGNVVTSINPVGGTKTYVYDDNDNLIKEVDELGRETTRNYDNNNRRVTETTPRGRTLSFTYDQTGMLASATDNSGDTIKYLYDARRNLMASIDAMGYQTSHLYDARGNETHTTFADGSSVTYEHDATGNIVREIDSNGTEHRNSYGPDGNLLSQSVVTPTTTYTTTYQYDANGRVIGITDPLGRTSKSLYDFSGNVIESEDANGHKTRFQFDALGQLIAIIFPDDTPDDSDNPRVTYNRDKAGRLVEQKDEMGATTDYELNGMGLAVRTLLPANPEGIRGEMLYSYDVNGRLLSQTNPTGAKTKYRYDDADNVIEVSDALGFSTHSTYDLNNRKISTVDAEGRATNMEYDPRGLPMAVGADGSFMRFEYDARGRKTASIDPLGNRTVFQYDHNGNLTSVTDALGGVQRYGYDERNLMISSTDPNGNRTAISYDAAGQSTTVTLPTSQQRKIRYDGVGNVISETDYEGNVTRYEYDTRNRKLATILSNGGRIGWTYNERGDIVQETDDRGVTVRQIGENRELLSVKHPDGSMELYTYDLSGNKTSVSTVVGLIKYSYDALGRMSRVTSPAGQVTTYSYDRSGLLSEQINPNGIVENFAYDSKSELIRSETKSNSNLIRDVKYAYDAAGNRIRVDELGGRLTEFEYDPMHRISGEIVHERGKIVFHAHYEFDAASNRILIETSNDGTTLLTYDQNNRLVGRSGDINELRVYDKNGNLVEKSESNKTQKFRWNSIGQLVDVDTDGNNQYDVHYRYDASGNRVETVSQSGMTKFVLDETGANSHVLAEVNSEGNVIKSYVFGLSGISQSDSSGDLYFLSDAAKNTRAVTNNLGVVVGSWSYDSLGGIIQHDGVNNVSLLFAGEESDSETGLNYLRSRYLDVQVGAFVSPDSTPFLTTLPISGNTYLYALANSQSFQDPSGQSPLTELAVVSSISGLVTGGLTFLQTHSALEAAKSAVITAGVTFAIGAFFIYLPTVFSAAPAAAGGGGAGLSIAMQAQRTLTAIVEAVPPSRIPEILKAYRQVGTLTVTAGRLARTIGPQLEQIREIAASVPAPVWSELKILAQQTGNSLKLLPHEVENLTTLLNLLRL